MAVINSYDEYVHCGAELNNCKYKYRDAINFGS